MVRPCPGTDATWSQDIMVNCDNHITMDGQCWDAYFRKRNRHRRWLKNAFLTSEEQVITSKSGQLTVANQFWNISPDVEDSPCKRARNASRWWEHHGWKSVTSLLVSTPLEQSREHALSWQQLSRKCQGPQCNEGFLSSKRCLKCLKGIMPFDPNGRPFLDKETDVQRN